MAWFLPFTLLACAACAAPGEPTAQESSGHQAVKVPPSVAGESVCSPTASTLVELEARRFVFAIDRSSATAPNWSEVTTGLKGFFASGSSTGIEASLHLFPTSDSTSSCSASTYAIPHIPSYPLPNDSLFSRLLSTAKPTGAAAARAALAGAVADARAQAGTGNQAPPEVVFVSSGALDACSGASPFADLRAEAESAFSGSPSVRVHLLTLGDFGAAADAVAKAGGTEKASVLEPGATLAANLLADVASIATPPERCSIALPEGAKSMNLATTSIFVGTTRTDASYVPYSVTCETGVGFRVDDINHPQRLEFCEASCATARNERVFRINAGCKSGTDILAVAPAEDVLQ